DGFDEPRTIRLRRRSYVELVIDLPSLWNLSPGKQPWLQSSSSFGSGSSRILARAVSQGCCVLAASAAGAACCPREPADRTPSRECGTLSRPLHLLLPPGHVVLHTRRS